MSDGFCKKCGNQLSPQAEFCTKCGTKVIVASNIEPTNVEIPKVEEKPTQVEPKTNTEKKQKKEWYSNWWGIIIAILFFPYFIIYYAWAKSKWSQSIKIVATVVCGALILMSIGIMFGDNTTTTTKITTTIPTPADAAAKQKADADAAAAAAKQKADADAAAKQKADATAAAEEMKATISFNGNAIKVTNLEGVDWVGCQININDKYGYKTTVILKNDSVIVPFSSFTSSQGTRFNYLETAPKNVTIDRCLGDNINRSGYYVVKS